MSLSQERNSDFSDFTDAIDHDYDVPIIRDCLIYFLTGQICKNFSKFRECENCRSGFFYSVQEMTQHHPWARIITNDEDGFLQHTNIQSFNVLKRIETSFEKYCNKSNVFDLVISEVTIEPF